MLRIIAILVALLLIAGAIVVDQHKMLIRVNSERHQAISFAKRDSANAMNYKNKFDHQVQRNEITDLSLRNAQDLRNTDRLAFIQELQGVKQNMKNLESAVRIQARATADLRMQLHDTTIYLNGDTLHVHKFGYADKYNSIRGLLEGDTTILANAMISVPLEGAVYWERTKLLGLRIGRKKFYSEFTTPNKWVKIDNSEYIKIQKR
jgi:hypothetical protein